MKFALQFTFKYLPLALGLLILVVGSFFVPWHEVGPYLAQLSFSTYLLLFTLGLAFYFARIVRYGFMLKTLGHSMSLSKVAIAYFVSQPVSLLPAGEMYRSMMLKKHGNVPMVSGVPVVFVQSFTENIGLVSLALFSAIMLHRYVLIVVGVAIVYAVILAAVHLRSTAHTKSFKLLNKLPLIQISKVRFMRFIGKNQTLLSGRSLTFLLISSLGSSLIATTALFVCARGFDVELSFVQAVIAFTLPMILQNVTFLPGGLGVNEQSSVGVLLLVGIPLPAAVALTLIIRLLTVGVGLLLGLIAISYTKLSSQQKS